MTHPAHLLAAAIVAAWATVLVLLWSFGHAPLPPGREPCLARLNRLCSESRDLIDALGRVVVPLAAAVVALFGVVLTVLAGDAPVRSPQGCRIRLPHFHPVASNAPAYLAVAASFTAAGLSGLNVALRRAPPGRGDLDRVGARETLLPILVGFLEAADELIPHRTAPSTTRSSSPARPRSRTGSTGTSPGPPWKPDLLRGFKSGSARPP